MGEMADYFYDKMLEEYMERDLNIEAWLEYSDLELIETIKSNGFYKSKYTEMTKDICNYGAPLSKKQRRVLAMYIVFDYRS